jgi:hypothetical protein
VGAFEKPQIFKLFNPVAQEHNRASPTAKLTKSGIEQNTWQLGTKNSLKEN